MRTIVSSARSRRPKRALAVFAGALIFSVSISPASAQTPVSPLTLSETNIVRFVPMAPTEDTREGSCWTNSIAVSRHDAWRCSVGNAIHDPCFTIPPNHDRLVCDADPALKTGGFLLKLIKPLPKTSHVTGRAEPWILKLADGSICEVMTGTLSAVNGQPARWSCAIHIRDEVRPAGVVTTVTPGKIWMADRYSESAIGNPLTASNKVEAEKVPVKTIWE
jgi:hypothetical protein